MSSFLKHRFLIIITLILAQSCQPSSIDDYKEKGHEISYSLLRQFQKIKSRQDLVDNSQIIEKYFHDLVDVMINARIYLATHPQENDLTSKDHDISDRLRYEMSRIYQIDGCREIIERCQQEALVKLDLFEKKLEIKRESLHHKF